MSSNEAPQPADTHVPIRDVRTGDAESIADIYNHYVRESIATFEEQPVSAAEMGRRIESIQKADLPWLVAGESSADIVGFAYAAPWKHRSAYRFSTEITAYLAPGWNHQGVGSRLYEALIPRLQERGIHSVVATIALPNDASVALHEKFGLEQVGLFTEQGCKFGRWIDVGYWQRLL